MRNNILINGVFEGQKDNTYEGIKHILKTKVHLYPCVILCSTKNSVDDLYKKLDKDRFNVVKYHSGMKEDEKQKSFSKFMRNIAGIFVTTGCPRLSMKKDIRFLIHNNMPLGFAKYLSDIELAGQDENLACTYLFWCEEDINLAEYAFKQNHSEISDLYAMIEYCREAKCPEEFIQTYLDGNWRISHKDYDYKAKRRYIPRTPRIKNEELPHYEPIDPAEKERKRREYIAEKRFGGMGMPSDECDAWNYVASRMHDDESWSPPHHFSTGYPSDEDDYISEAYYYLNDANW